MNEIHPLPVEVNDAVAVRVHERMAAHRLVDYISARGDESFVEVADLIDKVFLKQFEIK